MARVKPHNSPNAVARVRVVKEKIAEVKEGYGWIEVRVARAEKGRGVAHNPGLHTGVLRPKLVAATPTTGIYGKIVGHGKPITYKKKGTNEMKQDVHEFRQSTEVLTEAPPKISALRRISLINKFKAFGEITKDMSKGEKEYLEFYTNMNDEQREEEISTLTNVLIKA